MYAAFAGVLGSIVWDVQVSPDDRFLQVSPDDRFIKVSPDDRFIQVSPDHRSRCLLMTGQGIP